jgi:uncharacterized protein
MDDQRIRLTTKLRSIGPDPMSTGSACRFWLELKVDNELRSVLV